MEISFWLLFKLLAVVWLLCGILNYIYFEHQLSLFINRYQHYIKMETIAREMHEKARFFNSRESMVNNNMVFYNAMKQRKQNNTTWDKLKLQLQFVLLGPLYLLK